MHIFYLKYGTGNYVRGFRPAAKTEDRVIYSTKEPRIYRRHCDLTNSILNVFTYEQAIKELKHLTYVDHHIIDANIIRCQSLEKILTASFKRYLKKKIKYNTEILDYYKRQNITDTSEIYKNVEETLLKHITTLELYQCHTENWYFQPKNNIK